MNNNVAPIEALFEKAEDYGKTTIELFRLNAIDKSSRVISSLATKLVISVAATLFVLIITIAIALWLGELLGKSYYGFFVIGGCYAFIVLLLYSFRVQWIKIPVSNSRTRELHRIG